MTQAVLIVGMLIKYLFYLVAFSIFEKNQTKCRKFEKMIFFLRYYPYVLKYVAVIVKT